MKAFLFLWLLCFSLGLGGCHLMPRQEQGVYTCAAVQSEDGMDAALFSTDGTLELGSLEQAWLTIDGERYYARWRMDGDQLCLDVGGVMLEGRIRDGVCTLYYPDSALTYTFVQEGNARPEPEAEPTEAPWNERQQFWNGDWYGVWQIRDAEGKWQDQSGQFFDCFARIHLEQDGTATMLFWDELQSAEEPIAQAELLIGDGPRGDVFGVAVSVGGLFLQSELGETQWSIEPGSFRYDACLVVDNCRYEGEEGSFSYSILLRPWGRTWEDMEETETELLPYFYYDWYLPTLAAGEPMPEVFIPPEATVIRDTGIADDKENEE